MQRYSKQLNKKGELSDTTNKEIHPQYAKLVRAHGLSKVNKIIATISSFRPIIEYVFEYVFVLLNVVSLFTNASFRNTVNIILESIYREKVLQTTLTKDP